MRLIATVAFKGLGVELTFPISGHFQILEPTCRGHQITSVGAEALAFAVGTAFSPGGPNEGSKFLVPHQFDHRAHRALSKGTQMLVKFLLLRQRVRRWLRL